MPSLVGNSKLLHSLCMALAVFLAYLIYRLTKQKLPLSEDEKRFIALAAFLGAMIGSKLPFLIDRNWQGLNPWVHWLSDGKTVLGGLFIGYLAVEATKLALGIKVKTGDAFAMPIAAALCVGRIGCFFGGCCFGNQTDLPWGVCFQAAGDAIPIPRHPTQLYEAIFHATWLLILAILTLGTSRNTIGRVDASYTSENRPNQTRGSFREFRWLEGHLLKAYLLCYLAFRFLTESIRPEPTLAWNLTVYQFACILLAIPLMVQWSWQVASDSRS
jgi:phosphatidylglycerol:prolipoprotein diacylglycerol transferase